MNLWKAYLWNGTWYIAIGIRSANLEAGSGSLSEFPPILWEGLELGDRQREINQNRLGQACFLKAVLFKKPWMLTVISSQTYNLSKLAYFDLI